MLPMFVRAVLFLGSGLAAAVAVCFVAVWHAGWFVGVLERFRALATGEDVSAALAVGSLVLAVWSGVAFHEETVIEPWDDARLS